MTEIKYHAAPRWRLTQVPTRERSKVRHLAVALEPTAILIRPKGTRQTVRLPLGVAYQMACRLEADRKIAARKAARAAKRNNPEPIF